MVSKDSKKLSKKKREELYQIVAVQAITIGIGESDVENIDKLNIREATFRAMKNALKRLDPKPDKALYRWRIHKKLSLYPMREL